MFIRQCAAMQLIWEVTDKYEYMNLWMNILFVCLTPYIPDNNFSDMSGRVFLGWTSTKQRMKCLVKAMHGHERK